jgi:hypothetical protein
MKSLRMSISDQNSIYIGCSMEVYCTILKKLGAKSNYYLEVNGFQS